MIALELKNCLWQTNQIFVSRERCVFWVVSGNTIRDKTARTVLDAFKMILSKYYKNFIKTQTDNGSEFNNPILKRFLEMKNIQHRLSAANTPQTNGIVERANKTSLGCWIIPMSGIYIWETLFKYITIVIIKNCNRHQQVFLSNIISAPLKEQTWCQKSNNCTPIKMCDLVLKIILKEHAVKNKLPDKFRGS